MSVFRSVSTPSTEPTISIPNPVENKIGASYETVGESEPIELREDRNGDIVLDALGIDEDVSHLPDEDKENLGEVKNYILDIMKQKGLKQTVGAFNNTLNNIKIDLGLDSDTEPSIVLQKIGGIVKSWKGLSFIRDPYEKRSLFMKLARAKDSSDMDRIVMESMEKHKIWR